jgi:hypothetical protein
MWPSRVVGARAPTVFSRIVTSQTQKTFVRRTGTTTSPPKSEAGDWLPRVTKDLLVYTTIGSGISAAAYAAVVAKQADTKATKVESNVKADLKKIESNVKADLKKIESNVKADLKKIESNVKADMAAMKKEIEEKAKLVLDSGKDVTASLEAKAEAIETKSKWATWVPVLASVLASVVASVTITLVSQK